MRQAQHWFACDYTFDNDQDCDNTTAVGTTAGEARRIAKDEGWQLSPDRDLCPFHRTRNPQPDWTPDA